MPDADFILHGDEVVLLGLLAQEPTLAGRIACAHQAGDAHARIDAWDEALPWLLGELTDQATKFAEKQLPREWWCFGPLARARAPGKPGLSP